VPAPLADALLRKVRAAPTSVVAVARNFGWMVASRGLAAVFSLVYLAIVTRSLGVAGFGRFALITGAAQLLSSLFAFQTWQIIVQYGVDHLESGDEDRLARLYRTSLLLDVSSAVLGVMAAGFILYFFAEDLGLKDTLARATMVFNTVMLLSTRSTAIGILRLRDRFSLAAAADSITPIFRLIGAVVAFLVHSTLQGYLIAWAAAELVTAAAHWIALGRIGELRLLLRRGVSLGPVLTDNPGIARYAITTNFSQSLTVATRQLPLFLVGGLTGTAAAGAFRLAAQLSRSLTIVSQMIARAAFPEIVRAVRQSGVVGIGAMIARTVRFAAVVSAAVIALVLLLGRPILQLIGGKAFGEGHVTLLWLAGAGCVDLIIVAFEPSIAAAQRAHQAFFARLIAGVVMIAAALILAPRYGADGVAAAVFVNGVTQALLLGALLGYLIAMKTAAPLRADAA
jgi:O-antigen/teichoic acid export membrane protein